MSAPPQENEPPEVPLRRASALGPFAVRNYRFQWLADLLVSWAFEMETLILGWYVLVETGSVLMLTLFGALQFLGTLIAPMFGVAGDRIGYRNLLAGMRAVYATLAATLMLLAFTGILDPMLVLVLASLCGLVRPSDQGLRGALVAETMPAATLVNAMGVSRMTTDSARVAGALAGAGLFALLGMGPAYVAVTSFYALGFLLTLAVTPHRRPPDPLTSVAATLQRVSPWRDLKEGLVYVWRTPQLRAGMCIAFLANLAAFPLTGGLMPYVAREIYATDQTGLGLLLASVALGALTGSVVISLVSRWVRAGRMMVVFALAWFAMLIAFAQAGTFGSGVLLLMVVGVCQTLSMVPLSVMLLRCSDEKFRGRVMGVRVLAVYGLPIGLLVSGVLIEHLGFHTTATLYASVGLVFTLLIALVWRADLWRLEAPANAR